MSVSPIDFLESLPKSSLDVVYRDEHVAISVFRALSSLAQQILLRTIVLNGPFPVEIIRPWIRQGEEELLEHVLAELVGLRLIDESQWTTMKGTQHRIEHNKFFRESLLRAVDGQLGSSGAEATSAESKGTEERVRSKEIVATSHRKWRSILCSLVASAAETFPDDIDPVPDEDPQVFELMEAAQLLAASSSASGTEVLGAAVTPKGFQFLLKDTWEQLWQLLIVLFHVLENQENGPTRNDAICLVLRIGVQSATSRKAGYDVSLLPGRQRDLLGLLDSLGVVHCAENVYYITPLSGMLCLERKTRRRDAWLSEPDGEKGEKSPLQAEGKGIIVETNYSVHALNADYVQIQLLKLFVTPMLCFPNLFVGHLTRHSVRAALAMGISAADIIQFLTAHCHPQQAKLLPIVPETVQDQIRFWEEETKKVTVQKVNLYSDFETVTLLKSSIAYAKELQAHIWSCLERGLLVVKGDMAKTVSSFIKARKKEEGLA